MKIDAADYPGVTCDAAGVSCDGDLLESRVTLMHQELSAALRGIREEDGYTNNVESVLDEWRDIDNVPGLAVGTPVLSVILGDEDITTIDGSRTIMDSKVKMSVIGYVQANQGEVVTAQETLIRDVCRVLFPFFKSQVTSSRNQWMFDFTSGSLKVARAVDHPDTRTWFAITFPVVLKNMSMEF